MCLRMEKTKVKADKPYLEHLGSSADLVTTYAEIRAGFLALALEKSRRATPFVAEARALKAAATQARSPWDLLSLEEIQPALLSAAGISDKAAKHLQPEDRLEALQRLIRTHLEPAGTAFVEELVFRFLLTRGDALGGSMRNIGGVMAQRKLTRALISTLRLAGVPYRWLHSANNTWTEMLEDDADIELYVRGLAWERKVSQSRTVIYNLTVPLVGNNIDLSLFNCAPQELSPTVYRTPTVYLAFGELKGGIDPAGADEHWKTARTALQRVRQAFAQADVTPHTFFIGAAIEKRMADEIWAELQQGSLTNAANLTDPNQLASLARWLCSL